MSLCSETERTDYELDNNWKYILPLGKEKKCLLLGDIGHDTVSSLSSLYDLLYVTGPLNGTEKRLTESLRLQKNCRVQPTTLTDLLVHERSFDLVIMILGEQFWKEDRRASLQEAYDLLSSSGLLFLGGVKRRGESMGAIMNTLKEIGFATVKSSAHLPSHQKTKVILPLTSRLVSREALKLYHDVTAKQRLLRRAAILLIQSGMLGACVTDFSILAGKSSENLNLENDAVRQMVQAKGPSEKMDVALRSASAGKGSKAILQVMESDRGQTRAFVKLADNEQRGLFIEHEYKILQKLINIRFNSGIIPEIVDYKKIDNMYMLILSPPDLPYRLPSKKVDLSILNWLVELNIRTSRLEKYSDSNFNKVLRENAEKILIQSAKKEQWFFHLLEGMEKDLGEKPLPFGLAHRDFVAWNVRRCGGKLYVMDWEWAREDHIPFMDLFHYALHGEFHLGTGDLFHTAERLFFKKSYLTKYIDSYCRALSIDPSTSFSFFVLYLMDWVLFEMQNSPDGKVLSQSYLDLLKKIYEKKESYANKWPIHSK